MKNPRNRRQIKNKSTKSSPNHKNINEIDTKSERNQLNRRQLSKASTKSTPDHKKSMKSTPAKKNQGNRRQITKKNQ